MSVNDRVPKIAIMVTVSEVFMHCAKAFRRSHLWSPDHFQDRSEMPSSKSSWIKRQARPILREANRTDKTIIEIPGNYVPIDFD
jgi:hypothetical protein